MTDVAPGLLEDVEGRFRELYEKNRELRDVIGRVEAGTATYADAQQYAELVSRDLTGACASVFTDGALPDGRMYWNIADRVLRPVIGEQTELIADVCERTQTALNQAAGIGMKAVRVQTEPDRVQGILDEAARAETFSDVAGQVYDHIENLGRHVVDESVRQNADAQYKAGFSPKVHRTASAGACQWCQDRAGSYEYAEVRGRGGEVWQRHANCGCLIEYEPRSGRRESVNNYRWDAERADIAERKAAAEALTSDADPARIETRKLAAARAAAEREDRLPKAGNLEGGYDPADIRRAMTQESHNFVIRENNHPDRLYGEVCDNIPALDGYYDIKAHGSSERVKIFGSLVDAEELARIIIYRKDYNFEPIRLLSCETGKITDGSCVAMELSRLLGVDVMAPTEDLFALEDGSIHILSSNGEKGWMRLFHSSGDYEDNIQL